MVWEIQNKEYLKHIKQEKVNLSANDCAKYFKDAIKDIKDLIREDEEYIEYLNENERRITNDYWGEDKLREVLIDIINILYREPVEKRLKFNRRVIDFSKKRKGLNVLDKDKAKEIPITEYIEFNRAGFAKCLWHNEKTPSLKYYQQSNTCYCFGCNESHDVIDVVMKLYNVPFKEALKILSGNK